MPLAYCVKDIQAYSSLHKQRAATCFLLAMKLLPLVLNVSFNFVQLFPKEAAGLEA